MFLFEQQIKIDFLICLAHSRMPRLADSLNVKPVDPNATVDLPKGCWRMRIIGELSETIGWRSTLSYLLNKIDKHKVAFD